ncbi:hypothetical protein S245_012353, partial [Arachis hypogaea]
TGVPSSSLVLPLSTAPSPARIAFLNRASTGAFSLMTPSTMLPRSRPSLARPLKLATPCCPTASPLLGTRLVAILLPATDAHQHEDQSFWDDIEEEPRSLDPLGLQQYDRINSINNQLSREDTS